MMPQFPKDRCKCYFQALLKGNSNHFLREKSNKKGGNYHIPTEHGLPNADMRLGNIGSLLPYGPSVFSGDSLPKPGAVIMQYTGHSDYTDDDPPTFAVAGENDGIANWRAMERRINALKNFGIDAEFHKYPNLRHGFGLGVGTDAENWINHAARFWEKHIHEEKL
jgi:acetyl esterase/lipase